jgi:hypothetical protein
MKTLLASVVAIAIANAAVAQSPRQQAAESPVGTWRGTSLCLVRPSACKDEAVVYRIARTSSPDSLALDGRKVVRGEEQEMGVLACGFTAAQALITCVIPSGTWEFRVRNDSLVGELRLSDNTKFRDVRTSRAP